jgi:hypothetical protein
MPRHEERTRGRPCDGHRIDRSERGRGQKSEFLKVGGGVVDVCGGGPCYANGYTGP